MNPCEHALCSAEPAVAHNTGSSSLVRLPRDTDIRQGANRLAHVTGFTEFTAVRSAAGRRGTDVKPSANHI